jgi:hypothetical protein
MRCLAAFGERIAAREPARQNTKIHIRIAMINRFSDLEKAEIIRVGKWQQGKGASCPEHELRNNAHHQSPTSKKTQTEFDSQSQIVHSPKRPY